MLKSNRQLKDEALDAVKANRWKIIGAICLAGAASGVVSSALSSINENLGSIGNMGVVAFAYGPIVAGVVLYLAMLLRQNPEAAFSQIFTYGFGGGRYWRHVGAFMWMFLKTFLWSLLLIIPGIIKGYAYTMTMYITAMFPAVSPKEALKISERIMKGKKGKLFGMHMSFIGWYILGCLTLGILLVIRVLPQIEMATVNFYEDAMREAIEDGTVTRQELGLA